MRRFQSMTSAAPTSTFFGSHPRRAQVPPKGLESTTATCFPALRQRMAAVEAAVPVPITTTSYFVVTFLAEALGPPRERTHGTAASRPLTHIHLLKDYLDCSALKPAFSIVFSISGCVTCVSS